MKFNAKSAGVTSMLLIMAFIGTIAPTLFYQTYGSVSTHLTMRVSETDCRIVLESAVAWAWSRRAALVAGHVCSTQYILFADSDG